MTFFVLQFLAVVTLLLKVFLTRSVEMNKKAQKKKRNKLEKYCYVNLIKKGRRKRAHDQRTKISVKNVANSLSNKLLFGLFFCACH